MKQPSECGTEDVRPMIAVMVHVVHHRHRNQRLLNLVLELLPLSYDFVAFPLKIFFTAGSSKENLRARALICVCVLQVSFLDTDASRIRTRDR